MGDYTPLQVIVYDCPPDQVGAVLDVLEDHRLSEGWAGETGDKLALCTTYGVHEARGDESEEVGQRLIDGAPGCSFLAWTDPKYEWLGSLVAYTPDLGAFNADCDAEGQPQFEYPFLATLLGGHLDKTVQEFVAEVLPVATGKVWMRRFDDFKATNLDIRLPRLAKEHPHDYGYYEEN